MKISIVTPVKNSDQFIAETIESVINQRGDFEIEYFIVDGGSGDNTLKICHSYEEELKNAQRKIFCNSIDFQIISEPDKGLYDALTKGLKLATGEIMCYINADDFYLPNAFSCVSEIFLKYGNINWLTGLPIRFNEQGHIVNFFIPWQYNSGLILKGFHGNQLSVIQQESVFWRRGLTNNIDFENLTKYRLAGDYFLWNSFAREKTRLYIVDSFLSGNRLRKGQLSENKEKYYQEFNTIKHKSNLVDLAKVFIYWILEKYAGKPVKRRLSKNRISYKNGSWLLK